MCTLSTKQQRVGFESNEHFTFSNKMINLKDRIQFGIKNKENSKAYYAYDRHLYEIWCQ